MLYFGFEMADIESAEDMRCARTILSANQAKKILGGNVTIPCINSSHNAMLAAMQARYGISVAIPEKVPVVALKADDSFIIASVEGLPRLDATRHEYTESEIESCTFNFTMWTVIWRYRISNCELDCCGNSSTHPEQFLHC